MTAAIVFSGFRARKCFGRGLQTFQRFDSADDVRNGKHQVRLLRPFCDGRIAVIDIDVGIGEALRDFCENTRLVWQSEPQNILFRDAQVETAKNLSGPGGTVDKQPDGDFIAAAVTSEGGDFDSCPSQRSGYAGDLSG